MAPQVHPGQHVEQHQGDQALAVGRAFVDRVAPVVGLDRGHVLAPRPGEVLERVQPAQAVQMADQILGHGARVEGVTALFGNQGEGFGQLGLAMHLADRGRTAVGQEDAPGRGVALQERLDRRPVAVDPLVDDIAVPGEADGRLQHPAETHGAVIAQQAVPGVDRAGHGDRMGRLLGDRRDALTVEPLGPRRRGRPPGAVVGDDLLGPAGRDQGEAVAADPGRLGLDHALHRAGGHRGVHRVAAGLEHLDRRQRGERMGGRRHAVEAVDIGAAGEFEVSHGRVIARSWRARKGFSRRRRSGRDSAPAWRPASGGTWR